MAAHNAQGKATQATESEFQQYLKKSLVALTVGIPLFIISLLDYTYVATGINQAIWIVIGLLCLGVMWYSGRHFYLGAWLSFKNHNANMNTLIAVATAPAWLYSFIVSLAPTLFPTLARHVYYDAPMTVIGLLVLGAAIEMRVSEKVAASAKALGALQPTNANRIQDGHSQTVATERIQKQDIVVVAANSRIPVDGVIIEGNTTIDESQLTGSPTQANKKSGDTVFAGTLNIATPLKIQATHTAEKSALPNIVKLLKQAQNSKPTIGTIADRIAGIFAPLVLIISLITAIVWLNWGPWPQIAYMLVTFMAVLLIACPCALGLAAPISVVVGIGKAAQCGILFRQSDALQQARHCNTIVLDALYQDTAAAITLLRKKGMRVIFLGNQQIISDNAHTITFDEVIPTMAMTEKIEAIQKLQQQGAVVVMVGNGISDNSLLQQADLSIAMGIRSYLAKSIDIAITGESLYAVADVFSISRATLRNIKQNLTGAFIYNIVGIPIAAGVFYPLVHALLSPILAGALMACSSLVVITNANRLQLFKPTPRS